jgi:hypothetical protein
MEKYNLNEGNESLKRVLLMMKYDNKKTLSENVGVISEQNKAIRNKGAGLNRLLSLLSKLNPETLSKLPVRSDNKKGFINLGTQNIKNIRVKTNMGNLYFFVFKPGGYFTENNFVLRIKNGKPTIGTWDLDRIYFKNEGDVSITDSGFDNIININDLTSSSPEVDTPEKKDSPKPSQPSQEPKIPGELKNSEGVKKFQDWLDQNKQGWATGYPNGVLNKTGRGYGRFGPRTQKAWNQYKNDYLSSNTSQSQQTTTTTTINTSNQFTDYENEFVDGNF